ncbi:hypothetical protein [Kocuria sabuli]|uniref:hypothetical protein n=1 Tax=Kocuria sabuli TaxID=3071448 RepID=UPI0034D48F12
MTRNQRIRMIAATSALALGGSLLTAAPATASDGCYSFNKDTASCGWDGPPAPSTGDCSFSLALSVAPLLYPPSWLGLFWSGASAANTLRTC